MAVATPVRKRGRRARLTLRGLQGPEYKLKYELIIGLDLSEAAEAARASGEISAELLDAGRDELQRLFLLRLAGHTNLAATHPICAVWSRFIWLDTARYIWFCDWVFGSYFQHRHAPQSSWGLRNSRMNLEATYGQFFGQQCPKKIWGGQLTCIAGTLPGEESTSNTPEEASET